MIEWPSTDLLVSNYVTPRTVPDPLPSTLRASGSFRVSHELCEMGTPSLGTGFEVWHFRGVRQATWRTVGKRPLGRQPLADSIVAVRGLSQVLFAGGAVFPPELNTDISITYTVTTH